MLRTALRIVYENTRFSEDLDFTATKHISPTEMEGWIAKSIAWIFDHGGSDFNIQPLHFEIVNDEYGSESYQSRIYYRGPLRWGGSPRTVKLDITHAETILLPTKKKQIIHQYSDKPIFENSEIPCYSLEEVIAEKIRAIAGQRRFAVSRDLFDIYSLASNDIDINAIKKILPEKFKIRGLSFHKLDINLIENRQVEYEIDWNRRLNYLIINNNLEFSLVWSSILVLLKKLSS